MCSTKILGKRNVARGGRIPVFVKFETSDVGHDVICPARFVYDEAGSLENTEQACALFFICAGQVVVVGLRRFERQCSGLLQGCRRSDGEKIVDLPDGLRGFWRSKCPADAPARNAVRLGHPVDDDGVIAHAVDPRHGDVLGTVVEDVFVDFVGDAIGVPAQTEIANEFEFAKRENFPGRIVGRVDDDGLGAWAKRSGELVAVKRPIRRLEFYKARQGAGKIRIRPVILIERLEDDDFVAGIDDRHHAGHHGFRRAAADGDFAFGIIADVLGQGEFVDDRVTRGFAPQVMAYWLMSSEMAWRAASLISAGAEKSGKPWERLTALCWMAERVISRMTDSVNCSALAESMRRATWDMLVSGDDMGIDCSKGQETVISRQSLFFGRCTTPGESWQLPPRLPIGSGIA